MKTIWSVKFFAPCTALNEIKLSYFSYHDDNDASLDQWSTLPDSLRELPGVYLCVVLIKCEMLRPLSGLSNRRKDQKKYKVYFHSRTEMNFGRIVFISRSLLTKHANILSLFGTKSFVSILVKCIATVTFSLSFSGLISGLNCAKQDSANLGSFSWNWVRVTFRARAGF